MSFYGLLILQKTNFKLASKLFVTAKKELSESLVRFFIHCESNGISSRVTCRPCISSVRQDCISSRFSVYQNAFAMMIYNGRTIDYVPDGNGVTLMTNEFNL